MTQGHRPARAAARVAADAHGGRSGRRAATGVDVDGYRDYRGVPVVGAWTWLPDADIGVATEIDYAEAFRPLTILRRTFWGLFALLALAALAIFVFTRDGRPAAARGPKGRDRSPADRPVQARTEARRRRHGRRLQGPPRHAPPADGDQDARRRQGERGLDGAVRARGADHQPAQPSEHGGDLRLRPHARGRVLLRDGVSRRHRPADARRALRSAAGAARDSHSRSRSAARCTRPIRWGWCIATSSRPTSCSTAAAASRTW